MTTITNSLGSNYSRVFARAALSGFFSGARGAREQLATLLRTKFDRQPYFFYKGRDAIEFGLLVADLPFDSLVLTQAFACAAIEEAIVRTAHEARYVDIAPGQLNLSVKTLEKSYDSLSEKDKKRAKAVLVQHSLGTPAEIAQISQWCKKKDLLLIEDLAQSVGGSDAEGKPLGSYGDIIILSFGKDKIIDAVSGGACLVQSDWQRRAEQVWRDIKPPGVPLLHQFRDALYPLVTSWLRPQQHTTLGKGFFWLARLIGLLPSPTKSVFLLPHQLPAFIAGLALLQFEKLDHNLEHRRTIAQIYWQKLTGKPLLTVPISRTQIEHGANLRFPLLVKNAQTIQTLLACLAERGYHLADRWYRQPVDCGRDRCDTSYQHSSCPNAEIAAQTVFNLPTHQFITPAIAEEIADITIAALENAV